MQARFALFSTSVTAGVLLCGCAGSNGPEVVGQTLSGVINTTSFSVPAGETRRVNADLRINASGDIKLEGTLLVDEGVQITLDAQDQLILGEIRPSGIVTPSGRADNLVTHVLVGQRALARASQQWPPNTNLSFVSRGQGDLTVSAPISLQKSSDGRPKERGTYGGSIEVGTAAAIQAANDRQIPGTVSPNVLTIAANMTAGDGGNGGDDVTGIGTKDKLFQPGSGESGGNIRLQAGTIRLNSGTLTPGKGGDAGWAGRARGATVGYGYAGHGTRELEIGGECRAYLGNGGSAGSVDLLGTIVGALNKGTARGGQISSFFGGPGNGGLSGPGGNLQVVTPEVAPKDSTGSLEPQENVFEVKNAGNGGAASNASSIGGTGGFVINGSSRLHKIKTLRFINSFRGGRGFDGCAANPKGPGSNGGSGGILDSGGAAYLLQQDAFSGGDAGDYMNGNATRGGAPGKLKSGGSISRQGFDGYPCNIVDQTFVAAHDIRYGGVVLLQAGNLVSVKRFRGFHYSGPEGGCSHDHLHGTVFFDGFGPIPDPDPTGCGHAHAQ